jgi:hypothetical protein
MRHIVAVEKIVKKKGDANKEKQQKRRLINLYMLIK